MTTQNTRRNEWLDKYIAGEQLQYKYGVGSDKWSPVVWQDFDNPAVCHYAGIDLLKPGAAPCNVLWRVKPEPKRGWMNIYRDAGNGIVADHVLYETYKAALEADVSGYGYPSRFAIIEVIEGQGITY